METQQDKVLVKLQITLNYQQVKVILSIFQ